jgi:hypothetical protein
MLGRKVGKMMAKESEAGNNIFALLTMFIVVIVTVLFINHIIDRQAKRKANEFYSVPTLYEVQLGLEGRGYLDSNSVDGIWGNNTRKAWEEYEKDKYLYINFDESGPIKTERKDTPKIELDDVQAK